MKYTNPATGIVQKLTAPPICNENDELFPLFILNICLKNKIQTEEQQKGLMRTRNMYKPKNHPPQEGA